MVDAFECAVTVVDRRRLAGAGSRRSIGLTSITGHIPDPDGLKDANGNVIMRSIYSELDGEVLYLLDDARYQDSLAHT